MSKTQDFDQAVAEAEPLRFKVKGRWHEIPGDPPAFDVLALYRDWMAGTLTDPIAAMEGMLTPEVVTKLREDKITTKQLNAIITWVVEELGIKPTEADMKAAGIKMPEGSAKNPMMAALG